MLPQNLRVKNVLECFLLGGLTPWDSFYCVPGRGEVDKTFAYLAYPHLLKATEGCGFATQSPFTFFGKDSAGQEVFFGPFMGKLLARADVAQRLRVVVTRHDSVTHEEATILAATGRSRSHPAGAALGAHISRYFSERDGEANHPTPFSYGFGAPAGFTFSLDNKALGGLGLHPGVARPQLIDVLNVARLDRLLRRAAVGSASEQAQYDAAMQAYFDRYAQRLKVRGEAVRAKGFDDALRAFVKQTETDTLRTLLPASSFEPNLIGSDCHRVHGTSDDEPTLGSSLAELASGNRPAMGLRLARSLLTHPQHPARHCMVIDSGAAQADGGGGYDTHSDGPWRQASNLNNLLEHLLDSINGPGETDPNKLNLDETLIVLNTEFGRSPGPQIERGLGRSHWPHGFAQIYIGGPIREAQAGVYGHIDETGMATTFTTPAESRIAALLALGIYPFEGEAFDVGDVPGEMDTGAAARSVIRRVFGLTV